MIRNKTKILIFLFFPFIFFINCSIEEDFIEKESYTNKKISFRYLKGKEAVEKGNLLGDKLNISSSFRLHNKTITLSGTNDGIIDYSKVLEVIDTSGIVNYTYKVINHPEDNETTFHNLVLTQDIYGNNKVSLIQYQSEIIYSSIGEFQGKITTKSLSDATNPCDNSIIDADFNNGSVGGIDGGTDVALPPNPGDNNNTNPPYNPGSSGGGNSGNSLSDSADLTFMCNSCNFYSHSWSGFSSHTNREGVIYPFTVIMNNGQLRMATDITTNPCDPKGSIGIINDTYEKTPCEDLKQKTIDNIDFKNKIDSLKNMVLETNPNRVTHETMVTLKRLDDQYFYEVFNDNTTTANTVSVAGTISSFDVAVLHNHPINTLTIYSPRDIIDLFESYNFVTPSRKEEYTSYLVNFNNTTYAIKMENIGVLNDLIGEFNLNTEQGKKDADDKIMKIYKKYGFKETQTYTQEMAEELFLNVMNDAKFGNGTSIGIYRQNNGTWGKLSKSGGSVISTPCPN